MDFKITTLENYEKQTHKYRGKLPDVTNISNDFGQEKVARLP